MFAMRRLAARLLRRIPRGSSGVGREWAAGMLRELDFIESDWEALFWALGCRMAILRISARRSWFRFAHARPLEHLMRGILRKCAAALSGVAIAGILVVSVFALLEVPFRLFPSFAERTPWLPWLTVGAIPATIFNVAVVAFWRKRRPTAIGILLTASALGTHIAMRVMHSNYQ